MKNSTNSFVSYQSFVWISLIDQNIHGVRIPEVVKMEKILFFLEHVNRIKSVGLSSCSIVNLFRSITIKNSPFTLGFAKIRLESFAQTINKSRVDLGSDLNIVLAENDILFKS